MSAPIEIAVTCQRCRVEYLPSHADYVTGKWKLCPACRDKASRPQPQEPTPPHDESERNNMGPDWNNGLDGEKTETGRAKGGRFGPGNAGGPGRPRRATERAYLAALTEACPPETWKQIVETAVLHAGQGDRYAREWLASYLVGRPEGTSTTLHKLAVDELAGTDPVQQDADLAVFFSET